jgi:hypothetical protein
MGTYQATYVNGEVRLFTADDDAAAERDAFDAVELVSLSESDIKKMEAAAAKERKAEAENAEDDDE